MAAIIELVLKRYTLHSHSNRMCKYSIKLFHIRNIYRTGAQISIDASYTYPISRLYFTRCIIYIFKLSILLHVFEPKLQ